LEQSSTLLTVKASAIRSIILAGYGDHVQFLAMLLELKEPSQ